MANTTCISDLQSTNPAPSTTTIRRSSRLQAKQPATGTQEGQRSPHTHATASSNETPDNTRKHTASINEDEAKGLEIAAEVLLMLGYSRPEGHETYGSLPKPSAVITSIPVLASAAHQDEKAGSEKENVAAPPPGATTNATQTATAPAKAVDNQSLELKTTTTSTASKRVHRRALKRKATDDDAMESAGPALDARQTELRAIKRPRAKFVAEPSDRMTRSSRANVEIEGTGVKGVDTEKDESKVEVGLTEQVKSATSADSNLDSPIPSTRSPVDHQPLVDDAVERPRLTLAILAKAASAAYEHITMAAGTKEVGPGTNNVDKALAPTAQSAVTLIETEVGPKALSSIDRDCTAKSRVRVPGGKRSKSIA